MKTGPSGKALLKRWEQGPKGGPALTVYYCEAGKPTIAWGHVCNPADFPSPITPAQADAILDRDLVRFEAAVNRLVQVPLDQNQFDALVCFTFNEGEAALETSTLLKVLNSGRYGDVPAQLRRWDKYRDPKTKEMKTSKGLGNRREAEIELWSAP